MVWLNLSVASAQERAATNQISSKTIVFITGAFVSHTCWEEWRKYFEERDYTTIAPPWPHKNGAAADLRALRPNDTALAGLNHHPHMYCQPVKMFIIKKL